jgi:hypothetical protein
MGGRSGQRQDSTQTTTLPQDQQTNVDMLMAGARDFYRTGGPQYFGGNTVAGTDPNTLAGRTAGLNFAGGVGGNFTNSYLAGESNFLDPNNIYNPERMPGYARAREGVMTDVNNNLQRNILPSIRSSASANGVYGGSRQGIAEGLAAGEASRSVGDTLARMDMDAYGQGLGMYNAAAGRAPTSYGLGLAPSSTLQGIGEQYRADSQRNIDADMARWNFQQLAPLLNLQNFQGLTGTAGQYGGTTTGTQVQQGGGGNPWMQGVGALMSLASLWGGGK